MHLPNRLSVAPIKLHFFCQVLAIRGGIQYEKQQPTVRPVGASKSDYYKP
jgi:hypothetical protein